MDEYTEDNDFRSLVESIGANFDSTQPDPRSVQGDQFGLFVVGPVSWRSYVVSRRSVRFQNYDAECFVGDSAVFELQEGAVALVGQVVN